MSKKSALVIICLGLALVVAMSGCSSSKPSVKSASVLMADGDHAWAKRDWDRAAKAYGQVRDYYPYHDTVIVAQARAAEALFQSGQYVEALVAFESFAQLHPTHPELAHVLLRVGECHLFQTSTVDRDMSEAEQAIATFKEVISRFPKTQQAKDAAEYLKAANRKVVEHEVYVARFYRKQNEYKASLMRFERAAKYPNVGYDEVLDAELAIARALAAGKKRPDIDVPDPKKLDYKQPKRKTWFDRTWRKIKDIGSSIIN